MAFEIDLRTLDRGRFVQILHPDIDYKGTKLGSTWRWWTWEDGEWNGLPEWWSHPDVIVVSSIFCSSHSSEHPSEMKSRPIPVHADNIAQIISEVALIAATAEGRASATQEQVKQEGTLRKKLEQCMRGVEPPPPPSLP